MEMRVAATKLEESVVCQLPEGRELEIVMLCAEGDELSAVPDFDSAQTVLSHLGGGAAQAFGVMPGNALG